MEQNNATFFGNSVSDWIKKPLEEQLNDVYCYTIACVTREKDWYDAKSIACKRKALLIRGLCVLFVVISTILPLFSSPPLDKLKISPVFTTMCLILAGGLFSFDKIMGYSSTWTRLMSTKIKISSDIESFNIRWAENLTKTGGDLQTQQAVHMIGSCKSLVSNVNNYIIKETNQWISDFNANTHTLEDILQNGTLEGEHPAASTTSSATTTSSASTTSSATTTTPSNTSNPT